MTRTRSGKAFDDGQSKKKDAAIPKKTTSKKIKNAVGSKQQDEALNEKKVIQEEENKKASGRKRAVSKVDDVNDPGQNGPEVTNGLSSSQANELSPSIELELSKLDLATQKPCLALPILNYVKTNNLSVAAVLKLAKLPTKLHSPARFWLDGANLNRDSVLLGAQALVRWFESLPISKASSMSVVGNADAKPNETKTTTKRLKAVDIEEEDHVTNKPETHNNTTTKREEEDGESLHKPNGAGEEVELQVHRCAFVDWKPDGIEALAGRDNVLAVGRQSGEIEIWEKNSRHDCLNQRLTLIPGIKSQELRCLLWGKTPPASRKRLFGGNLDGTVFEVDFVNGTKVICERMGSSVWGMDCNAHSKVVTCCEDGRIRVYRTREDDEPGLDYERILSGGSSNRLLCVKFHGTNDDIIFAAGSDGIIRKWSLATRRVLDHIQVPSLSRSLNIWCLDTFGETLVCGDSLGRIHIWSDVSAASTPQLFSEHKADVLCVKIANNGTSVFASGIDNRVACFRYSNAEMKFVYTYSHRSHTHDVRALGTVSIVSKDEEGLEEILISGGIDAQLCWYSSGRFERVRPKKESPFKMRSGSVIIREFNESYPQERVLLVVHTFKLELWHVNLATKQQSYLAAINFDNDATIRTASLSKRAKYFASIDEVRGLKVFQAKYNFHPASPQQNGEEEENDDNVEEEAEIKLTKVGLLVRIAQPKSLVFGNTDDVLIVSNAEYVYLVKLGEEEKNEPYKRISLTAPLYSLQLSLDGQWLAGVKPSVNGIDAENLEVYNLDVLKRIAELPASLFRDSCHSSLTFTNNARELVVARLDGTIHGFALEDQTISWTVEKLPLADRIIGLKDVANEIYFWGVSFLGVVDPAEKKLRSVIKKYKASIHVEFVDRNLVFILEGNLMKLIKHLPDVVYRDRFGTRVENIDGVAHQQGRVLLLKMVDTKVHFVLDASNICWGYLGKKCGDMRPSLRGLAICINFYLKYERTGRLIAIAPSWWQDSRHMETEDQICFEKLCHDGIIILAPPKQHDDLVMLEYASTISLWNKWTNNVGIVTNDQFRDHQIQFGVNRDWVEDRRIGFTFENEEFVPNKDFVSLQRYFNQVEVPSTWYNSIPNDYDIPVEIMKIELDAEIISKLGLLIGRRGVRIKGIESKYGVRISVTGCKLITSALSKDRALCATIEFLDPVVNKHSFAPLDELLLHSAIVEREVMDIELQKPTSSLAPVEAPDEYIPNHGTAIMVMVNDPGMNMEEEDTTSCFAPVESVKAPINNREVKNNPSLFAPLDIVPHAKVKNQPLQASTTSSFAPVDQKPSNKPFPSSKTLSSLGNEMNTKT